MSLILVSIYNTSSHTTLSSIISILCIFSAEVVVISFRSLIGLLNIYEKR